MAGHRRRDEAHESRDEAARPRSTPRMARLPLRDVVPLIDGRLDAARAGDATFVRIVVPPGRWQPPPLLSQPERFLHLYSGALLHRRRRDRGVPALFLPGEIARIPPDPGDRWRVVSSEPAQLAVLTPATVERLAGIPGATHALLLTAIRQNEWSAELRGIVAMRLVEQRIVGFFDYLARRVGRPERDMVRIPLALDQKRIEEMLGAGHTQATGAFRSLVGTSALVHDGHGWRTRTR